MAEAIERPEGEGAVDDGEAPKTDSPKRAVRGASTARKPAEPENENAKARSVVVQKILNNMERKLSGRNARASLGDYIRLVQLQKELDEDAPKEIKVTWVETGTETKGQAKPDTTSGNGE